MDFLIWHYSYAISFYLLRLKNTILFINHQFSLNLLLPTLFSPWKRLTVVSARKGFNLARDFQEVTFNLVSRGIGAFVRTVLLITGSLAILFVAIIGLVGFILWILLPFLSYSLYLVHRSQPQYVVQNLLNGKLTLSRAKLLNSAPGEFLATHLGGSSDQVLHIFPETITLTSSVHESFESLVKDIINSNSLDEEVMRDLHIVADDILLASHWWDSRRSANTILNPEPAFTQPGLGLSLMFGYTPTLDKFSSNMGDLREFTHHLIGREEAVSRVERILTTGSGVLLTGVPGVGKKTVIYEFAKRAREGKLGREMSYKRILDFDYNAVIAGSTDISAKKQLLAQILAEAEAAGNVILLVRDLHRITNREVEGFDFTDIFTTYLEKRRLLLISIIDKSDYDRYLSRNERLKKFLEVVSVSEISKENAMDVLLSAARYSEKDRKIVTPVPALRLILTGSESYLTDTPFPEKALELLDAVLTYHAQRSKNLIVTPEEVSFVLSEKTGIALASLGDAQKKKLSSLESIIHERLVNQEYPISLIAKALRSKTSGVVKNARPIGSFLFLGPTGVGKTETAKVLADVYFGSSERIVRFDMAEFGGSEGLERLIGNMNRGLPGVLTTALKNNPACLLLLDEIEKAPPAVFNIFLSLLDEGKITDAFGKTISASHTFVVATSNAGSEFIRESIKTVQSKEELQKVVLDHVLKEHLFTPEFLNRFDGVVVYEPLTPDHLQQVARLQLAQLAVQMKSKGVDITFDESVYKKVAEEGYDPALGARPMRRMIDLTLGDFIANALLKSELKEGSPIRIYVDDSNQGFMWQPI